MKLVSIIIPCRDEELNIANTLAGIQRVFESAHISYEVIVVNDGSKDRTEEVVKELCRRTPSFRLIYNQPPHGIGNAIKKGLEEYRGDCAIIAMADASDDPKDKIGR